MLADSLEHGRVEALDEAIHGGLTLGEDETGEFVQQLEHGVERVVGDGHGFRPRPHPVHVDVRVRNAEQGVFLGRLADRFQRLLGAGDDLVGVYRRLSQRLAGDLPDVDDTPLPIRRAICVQGTELVGELQLGAQALELLLVTIRAQAEFTPDMGELRCVIGHFTPRS